MAAALTGLGTRAPPRPRRLSGRVTTRATSCPASTSVRSGATAASGVPRNTSRAMGGDATGPPRSAGDRVVTGSDLPVAAGRHQLGLHGRGVEPEGPVAQHPQGLLAHVVLEALDHQDPVEVVDLVLEHPAQEVVGLDGDLFAVEVVAPEVDLVGPDDAQAQAGDGEAALVVVPLARRSPRWSG